MADEVILEFLHMEIISQFYRSCEKADQDQCIAKLESLGFRIGQSLVERFTKDSSRFKDELDTMKFICKDFWNYVYKKQIDNLRTNHQMETEMNEVLSTMRSDDVLYCAFMSSCIEMIVYATERDKGVYVLQDNKFRFLTQISNGKQFMETAPKFLALPCGMIRGALSNLGVNCVVTAEVSAMPACKFQIQIQRL